MSNLLPKINKGLLIGVGAAFSFYSAYKNNKRAPNMFRKLKIEWLYRLLKEPKKTLPRLINNLNIFTKNTNKRVMIKPNFLIVGGENAELQLFIII